MKLIRYQTTPTYNPATNFAGLADELDRLFDTAFPTFTSPQRGDFPVDLYLEKDSYVVRAELPGFRKEDLSIEVADGVLTVTGHQKTESTSDKKDKETTVTTQERKVSRSVSLPEYIKVEEIKAHYENGVLTVTLPKREEVKPRQIAIDVK